MSVHLSPASSLLPRWWVTGPSPSIVRTHLNSSARSLLQRLTSAHNSPLKSGRAIFATIFTDRLQVCYWELLLCSFLTGIDQCCRIAIALPIDEVIRIWLLDVSARAQVTFQSGRDRRLLIAQAQSDLWLHRRSFYCATMLVIVVSFYDRRAIFVL